jgi:hypothetical protein
MDKTTLHIYDKTGKNVVKTYEAETYDLPFGTVKALMEILKIEDMKDQAQLLRVIVEAWDEVINALESVFPECTAEEWKTVKVKELLKVIISIAKTAISDIFIIPTEKN